MSTTNDILAQIRARRDGAWRLGDGPIMSASDDIDVLLAEVDRLVRELATANEKVNDLINECEKLHDIIDREKAEYFREFGTRHELARRARTGRRRRFGGDGVTENQYIALSNATTLRMIEGLLRSVQTGYGVSDQELDIIRQRVIDAREDSERNVDLHED